MEYSEAPLRICMISAEVRPYSSAGGLSDVLSALPPALEKLGVEVKVFSPLYRQVQEQGELQEICELEVFASGRLYSSAIYVNPTESPVRNYFIGQDRYFDREGIYTDSTGEGHPDNFDRFNFFMTAALDALKRLNWKPHVIHCHDSQTALVPAYLKLNRMADPFYKNVSSVMTIHNLAYQGLFEKADYHRTGLPPELFYPLGPFEFYGRLNMLKAGICYADVLNTVSPQYAGEIQTKEYGCGLESVLERRRADLYGILNGIDTDVWNPATDPLLFANYSADDLSGKSVNKKGLQLQCGFEVSDRPLVGIISRLVEQKGFDLLLEVQDELAQLDCQWVILGTGRKVFEEALASLAKRYPQRFSAHLRFDTQLSHRIEAGGDLFLMPSRYEPCGLNQMYSMRYGTIPVVRHTGGLADTVREFDSRNGLGTGFKFYEIDSAELLQAVKRALSIYADRAPWTKMIQNAMTQDFSWSRSAREYINLYRRAISHR